MLASLAAAKFKGLTFEDPISLQRVGRSRGVVLNKQIYNARGLKNTMESGYSLVPHSRRQLTRSEKAKIQRKSRDNRRARNTAIVLDTGASRSLPRLKPKLNGGFFLTDVPEARKKVSNELGEDLWAIVFVNAGGRAHVIYNAYAPPATRHAGAENRAREFLMNDPQVVLDFLDKKGRKVLLYFGHDSDAVMTISRDRTSGYDVPVYVFAYEIFS